MVLALLPQFCSAVGVPALPVRPPALPPLAEGSVTFDVAPPVPAVPNGSSPEDPPTVSADEHPARTIINESAVLLTGASQFS
jgi:hypothetical protein